MPPNPRDSRWAARRGRRQTTADQDAWCDAPAGVAFVGASSDCDADVAAWLVTDDATRPCREVPRSEGEAAGLEAAGIDQVRDDRAPTADALDGQVRDAVRARAQRAANLASDQRFADVVCRSRQVGVESRRVSRRHGRRRPDAGPTSAAPVGPLVVAFQRNARVWSGRRLTAPRCQRRSSGRCAGAGGC
jgi:hypothetical protein